jgi:acyl-CoA dehydrogenase
MTLDFSLTPEQQEIRKLAHDFAEREIRPVAAHHDETEEFPYEVVKKAHRLGLTPAAFLPEEYGGQNLDFLTELILNEELHWGCAGIAVCIQSMALAMAGIRASGTEEQKKRWLPEFTNPDKLVLGGLGLTEPDSGSDALSMKTRATRVSDGYVLNGTKQFCTNGGIADYHVIYANTDPSKGPAGIASFLVPKGTPGLRMGRKEKKLGVRASHTAQVILEDCHLPLDHRLGGEPDADNAGPGALGATHQAAQLEGTEECLI